MTKSYGMFYGFCEDLARQLDEMSDEEFEKEYNKNKGLIDSTDYKRRPKK